MKIRLLFLITLISSAVCHAQNTAIPDPNFEQRLIDMGYDTGMVDGVVPTANINTVTDLIVPNSNILDLTGIEDFAALEILDISGNGISNLILSSNLNLIELYVETNPLGELDLGTNSALEILRCGHTQLSNLDVSNNTSLSFLSCNNNQLCSLDVSLNPLLTTLLSLNNQLTYLNVKNGTNGILTTFNASSNSSLLCIQVDDEVAAMSGTGVYGSWTVDGGINYSENCALGPEMNVVGNTISIASGDITPDLADDTDFGTINFGEFVEHTFTIENSGDQDLNLIGVPLIEITNSTDFTVTLNPSSLISSLGGNTVFTLRYEPSMAGTINTATISISNDDCDENPYTFDVIGESSTTLNLQNIELRNQIRLYPNPSRGFFNLKYSGTEPIEKLRLYDSLGKMVKEISIENNRTIYQIDLGLPSGFYFLGIKTEISQTLLKLVII